MNKKKYDILMMKVHQESMSVKEMIEIIEIAKSSVKRNIFCKKHKLSYPQFMEQYQKAKGELMNYPVIIGCMEAVLEESLQGKNKYLKLVGKVVASFRELFKKSQKKITTKGADEMEKVLKDLGNEKKKST